MREIGCSNFSKFHHLSLSPLEIIVFSLSLLSFAFIQFHTHIHKVEQRLRRRHRSLNACLLFVRIGVKRIQIVGTYDIQWSVYLRLFVHIFDGMGAISAVNPNKYACVRVFVNFNDETKDF